MKRIAVFAVFFILLACVAAMAGVTVATPSVGKTSQGGSFIINAYTADGSGCEELKAAPSTSGEAIHIKSISIVTATPVTVTIGEGETTAGSVDTTVIGPIKFGSTAVSMPFEFYPTLRLTDNTSLVVDTDATGDVVIIVEGYIE